MGNGGQGSQQNAPLTAPAPAPIIPEGT
jgi:hypothetical protein